MCVCVEGGGGGLLLINGPVRSPMVARFQTKFGHCWLVGSGTGNGDIKEGPPRSSSSGALPDLGTGDSEDCPPPPVIEMF